jgi:uncharacterized protein YegL
MSNIANNLISKFFGDLVQDPVLDSKVRFRIIELREKATSVTQFTQASSLLAIPGVISSTSSSLVSAFESLKDWITADVQQLKQNGHRVHRPLVMMFLTSPSSGDDWRTAHRELTDRSKFRFAPNIICFGTDMPDQQVIYDVAACDPYNADLVVAYTLDHSVGTDVIVNSLFENFVKKFFSLLLSARMTPDVSFTFPGFLPGVSPIESVTTPDNQVLNLDRATDPHDFELEHTDGGPAVLPLYVVCDEGSSMSGSPIDEVNSGIAGLFRAIAVDPVVDEKARVGIITFNDSARVLLPLTQLRHVTQVPGCVASGSTSYASVFRLLRSEIETDVARLKNVENYRVHRPIVFFISNGNPVDEDWRTPWSELTDRSFKYRPNIVAFGVTGADAAVIKEVATPFVTDGGGKKDSIAFLAEQGVDPASALKELMRVFIDSDDFAPNGDDNRPTMAIPPSDGSAPINIDSI